MREGRLHLGTPALSRSPSSGPTEERLPPNHCPPCSPGQDERSSLDPWNRSELDFLRRVAREARVAPRELSICLLAVSAVNCIRVEITSTKSLIRF